MTSSTAPPRTLDVVLVDDSDGFRTVLRALLHSRCGATVVAEAADGAEAVPAVAAHRPDVVVTDFQMPGTDGIELTRQLRAQHPDLPIVMLTGFPTRELMQEAFDAGVSAFLDKSRAVEELPTLLEELLA